MSPLSQFSTFYSTFRNRGCVQLVQNHIQLSGRCRWERPCKAFPSPPFPHEKVSSLEGPWHSQSFFNESLAVMLKEDAHTCPGRVYLSALTALPQATRCISIFFLQTRCQPALGLRYRRIWSWEETQQDVVSSKFSPTHVRKCSIPLVVGPGHSLEVCGQ